MGRSAAGRALSEGAVVSAVVASVRHVDTPYDQLLMSGVARHEARRRIAAGVEAVLAGWRPTEAGRTAAEEGGWTGRSRMAPRGSGMGSVAVGGFTGGDGDAGRGPGPMGETRSS